MRSLTRRIATALGLFSSCIKSGEDWSPQCEQALRDAFDALRQLGERLHLANQSATDMTATLERLARSVGDGMVSLNEARAIIAHLSSHE
jgi:hypothetical protein